MRFITFTSKNTFTSFTFLAGRIFQQFIWILIFCIFERISAKTNKLHVCVLMFDKISFPIYIILTFPSKFFFQHFARSSWHACSRLAPACPDLIPYWKKNDFEILYSSISREVASWILSTGRAPWVFFLHGKIQWRFTATKHPKTLSQTYPHDWFKG